MSDAIGKRTYGEQAVLNDRKDVVFRLIARKGSCDCRIELTMGAKELNLKHSNLGRYFWNYIDNQIRKFQSCIYCRACNGVCPVSAIKIDSNSYRIDERLCIHCLKCVNHFSRGCLIASALETKKEDRVPA